MFGIYELNINRLSELEDMLLQVAGSRALDNIEDEVWQIAREYTSVAPIDNIHYDVLMHHIMYALIEDYPQLQEQDFEIYVNCYASSLSVHFNDTWLSLNDFKDLTAFLDLLENSNDELEDLAA